MKKSSQRHAGQRQQHRSEDRDDRRKRMRQRARRRQRGHAVAKRAEEDAERPLRHAVFRKADDDARRELHGRERQRHQQNREHDGNHRHDGGGDARQNDLRHLRIGVRREQRLRAPARSMNGNLSSSHDSTAPGATQRQRDDQRAHQEAAAQVVHPLTNQKPESLVQEIRLIVASFEVSVKSAIHR